MYACKDSAAPAHARTRTRAHRPATPCQSSGVSQTPHPEVHLPFIAPPSTLHSLPYCNTNARPLRNIRAPTVPFFWVNPEFIRVKGQLM